MKKGIQMGLLVLGLTAGYAHSGDNRFCGGPVLQTDMPADLSHVVGDQTLEFVADRPASLVVCMAGYELEKCGDHETASRVYDKCIAAGYVGAMIRKARMLENGAGDRPPDLSAATELMHRLAISGNSPYATLGKLHYASALHQGKGVAKDEVEAHKWFEAAARDGDPDAIEFLRTGHHAGERDGQGRGVGAPPSFPSSGFLIAPGRN